LAAVLHLSIGIHRLRGLMQPFPHHYDVTAVATLDGDVHLGIEGVPPLATASPPEFDGPGQRWSPEALLVGAVADCFILTFRGIARAAKLAWASLECDATGRLERQDGVVRFTQIELRASLSIPPDADEAAARQLLQKAEDRCLVSRSLNATVRLESMVTVHHPCCGQVQFPQHEAKDGRRI
jgi:peroxiredoxin-like protein